MKNKIIILAFIIASASLYINGQSKSFKEFRSNKSIWGFTENKGQVIDQHNLPQPDVKYLYNGNNFKLHLRTNSFSYELYYIEEINKNEIDMSISRPRGIEDLPETKIYSHRIDIELIGANSKPQIIAENRSANYTNFYTANTSENGIIEVYSYAKIIYKNIYTNIDLAFYMQENGSPLKYDFMVHPGGNVNDIKLNYWGVDDMELDDLNKLTIYTSQGNIEEQMPVVYEVGAKENILNANYQLQKNAINICGYPLYVHSLTFNIENYDKTKTLVIDPNLIWASYYGGPGYELGLESTTDDSGNVYMVGYTTSTSAIASGGYQNVYGGGSFDAFLVKFNRNGDSIQWATYYGGDIDDLGYGVTTDDLGDVYLAGFTSSDSAIASGGHQNIYGGGPWDAFLVKFNSAGVRQWATYYGDVNLDRGYGVSTDGFNNVYLVGHTTSDSAIALGGHQNIYGGAEDAFLVKFNSAGVRQWATYYGGTSLDEGYELSIDESDNIYLVGFTESNASIASTGHQNIFGGIQDAFLVKFNSAGVRQWATYYGGIGTDYGNGVCIDGLGNVYMSGVTDTLSTGIAIGGHQNVYGGGPWDGYLVKFNSAGVRQWASYYGGTGNDGAYGVSTDGDGNIYMGGYTASTTNIASIGFVYSGGNYDAYLVKFNPDGVRHWGIYYGGVGDDFGYWGVSTDAAGSVYLVGFTDNTIPTTIGAFQTIYAGGSYDAFLVKFETGFTEIPENNFDSEITIYPNPTQNDFYIDLGKKYETIKIEILNTIGQVIFIKEWLNTEIISMSIDNPTGIYLVNIISDNKKATYKLIKR